MDPGSDNGRDIFTVTQKHITVQEITWTLNSLQSFPEYPFVALDSPHFDFQHATWCLRLYPNKRLKCRRSGYITNMIGISIVRVRSRVPCHDLKYHLKSEMPLKTVCIKSVHFDENWTEHGCVEFLPRYFVDFRRGPFTVTCKIFREVVPPEDLTTSNLQKDLEPLSQHFKDLLTDGEDRDIVLKVRGREFRAHRDILRVRSPVFRSMLSHDMLERNSGIIDISDCDPDAFEQFLLYLYTGRVENLDADNMLLLYYMADKYDIDHLKKICRGFIDSSFTCANVSSVMQLAFEHCDEALLERAMDFFTKEMSSVLRTEEWRSFLTTHPAPANEILIRATDRYVYTEDVKRKSRAKVSNDH